jgi:3-oxoacyl-ACP reductase-like protein
MKTIHMGLNTEPRFALPENFDNLPEDSKKYLKMEMEKANELKAEIHKVMEEEGACELSWECTGRTRHQMHAEQWKEALPEYSFKIGYNYECKVSQKEGA